MPTSLAPAVETTHVREMLESGDRARVIDVRTPGEFAAARIPGSHNVPLDLLKESKAALRVQHSDPVVLVCASGARSDEARTLLANAGIDELSVLTGGVDQWEQEDAPVVRGEGRWAMERQVRLVAGSLVLTGVLTSTVFKPAKWLAGFIGAGLTFAAVSNTCAMAHLLSKLPYNRTSEADARALLPALTASTAPAASTR